MFAQGIIRQLRKVHDCVAAVEIRFTEPPQVLVDSACPNPHSIVIAEQPTVAVVASIETDDVEPILQEDRYESRTDIALAAGTRTHIPMPSPDYLIRQIPNGIVPQPSARAAEAAPFRSGARAFQL
jgi:hypothetical protein